MSARPAGLRLRLFGSLAGAVLLAFAMVTVPLLLAVRDELYAQEVAALRDAVVASALVIASECPAPLAEACADRFARAASLALTPAAACTDKTTAKGAAVCVELPGGALSLFGERSFAGVQVRLRSLDARLLAILGLGFLLLFALLSWLVERGVVRRLLAVDAALGRVASGEDAGFAQLPESGDVVGRLGVAVRHLGLRLSEERALTAAQIAELRAKNSEIREARAELHRSERLASVGRLAAGVAHEVGNPVTAVIGYAALLRDRLLQGKDAGDYVERIERETQRIDRILRDLLDLARPPPALPGAIRLASVLDAARAAVEPQEAFRGVALAVELPASLPAVRGEEHYLAQVFVNLLVNAARAGARTVTVTAAAEAGRVVALVRDDGRGLPAADLPRLFEPFFTTAAPGEGTGLGLALCYATMERFGGSIAAELPADGPGALFRLTFAAP